MNRSDPGRKRDKGHYFFLMFIYLFGCARSQLRHVTSSLQYVGNFFLSCSIRDLYWQHVNW